MNQNNMTSLKKSAIVLFVIDMLVFLLLNFFPAISSVGIIVLVGVLIGTCLISLVVGIVATIKSKYAAPALMGFLPLVVSLLTVVLRMQNFCVNSSSCPDIWQKGQVGVMVLTGVGFVASIICLVFALRRTARLF